jgi:hypothetical protein
MKPRAQKAKPQPPTPAPSTPKRALWRLRELPWVRIAFCTTIATLLLTALLQIELFMKLGSRALCYADWNGFWETATRPVPGGALAWCGELLATLFQVPWLGMLAFLGISVAVTLLGRFWCRLNWWAALAPCVQVVLQLTYCGFSAWIFHDSTFMQTYLLEWAACLFALGAVKRFGAWGIFAALLYPVTGISVLFGLIGAILLKNITYFTRTLCLATPILVVIAWKLTCYADPSWPNLLKTQTWFLFEKASFWWEVFTFLALKSVFTEPYWTARFYAAAPLKRSIAAIATPICLIATLLLIRDPNSLYSILRCERNLRTGDGRAALQLPESEIINHRMLSAYYIHGLWRAGQLEDKLFDMPWKVSHKSTTIDTMSLDGHWLLYHYGIVQMARRWCYESVIKLGWTPDDYALLTKVAIVCNEMPLARRYAQQLARIPFRGKEAAEYLSYVNGVQIPKTHELWRIAELHLRLAADEGSPTFEAGKKLEDGIYNRYAVLKNGNRDMVALYLCSSLLLQDTTALTENFDVICSVWPQRPLPRAFQQGLLAAAASLPPAQQPRLTANLFSPGMFEAFQAFQKEAPTANPTAESFRKRFGKSYWYYATFVQ